MKYRPNNKDLLVINKKSGRLITDVKIIFIFTSEVLCFVNIQVTQYDSLLIQWLLALPVLFHTVGN